MHINLAKAHGIYEVINFYPIKLRVFKAGKCIEIGSKWLNSKDCYYYNYTSRQNVLVHKRCVFFPPSFSALNELVSHSYLFAGIEENCLLASNN